MIKVDDRFEFEKDKYQWLLHEWREGQDKDGNAKRQKSTTYHGSLDQVARTIIDRKAGDCEDMEGLFAMLHDDIKATTKLIKLVAALEYDPKVLGVTP